MTVGYYIGDLATLSAGQNSIILRTLVRSVALASTNRRTYMGLPPVLRAKVTLFNV